MVSAGARQITQSDPNTGDATLLSDENQTGNSLNAGFNEGHLLIQRKDLKDYPGDRRKCVPDQHFVFERGESKTARAGEAGMGFAVVADEVRNLAQRCSHGCKGLSGIELKNRSNIRRQSKMRLDEVAAAMRQATESAVHVQRLSSEVNAGSRVTGLGRSSRISKGHPTNPAGALSETAASVPKKVASAGSQMSAEAENSAISRRSDAGNARNAQECRADPPVRAGRPRSGNSRITTSL